MKALVLEGPRRIALRDVPEPDPGPGEVVVQVEWSGVCGTDLHGYSQGAPLRHPPLIMGHEFSGVVTDSGTRVVVNPRVVCDTCDHCASGRSHLCQAASTLGVQRPGGFAERVAVPEANCISLPDDMDSRVAALTEALAVGFHGAATLAAHRDPGGLPVAVIGGGLVGLGLALAAQKRGARVTIADVSSERREQAQRHGIDAVTDGLDGDWPVIVEAVGSPAARALAMTHLAAGGLAMWVGLDTAPAEIDVPHLVRGERTITTSYCYTSDEFRAAIELCARFQPHELEIVPLTAGSSVFERDGRAAEGHARTLLAVGAG